MKRDFEDCGPHLIYKKPPHLDGAQCEFCNKEGHILIEDEYGNTVVVCRKCEYSIVEH